MLRVEAERVVVNAIEQPIELVRGNHEVVEEAEQPVEPEYADE